MNKLMIGVLVGMSVVLAFGEDAPLVKKLVKPSAWCRSGKIACTERGNGVWDVKHEGDADWHVSGIGNMKVLPGEIYEMACAGGPAADGSCDGSFAASVILRGANGQPLDWVFGKNEVNAGEKSKTTFMIPVGGESIDPRIVGSGSFRGSLGPCAIRRTGRRIPRQPAANLPCGVLSNEFLVVEISPSKGGLTIRDRRNGRIWKTDDAMPIAKSCTQAGQTGATGFWAKYEDVLTDEAPVVIRHRLTGPEIEIEIDPEDRWCEMPKDFAYPLPFTTKKGERIIVPNCEGMSYPVDGDGVGRYTLGSGWSISMSFFGIADPKTGEALMEIAETPWDASFVGIRTATSGKFWSMYPSWRPQMKTWGEKRRIRLVVFDKGGHVAMAKRYREYAKGMGWVKTFKEKAIRRPNVLKLPGAVNFWFWTKEDKRNSDPYKMVEELEACGIRHYIWSHGGSPDFVRMMNRKGILIGHYDIVQDVYTPEVMERTGKKGKHGPNWDAWPNDCIWTAPDSNKWQKAWGLELKGGGMVYCANMCDVKAPQYLRRRLGPHLQDAPFSMLFMDTTCSASLKECYNPRHVMNRNECVMWRQNLLGMMGDEFGLVVGTENGFDAVVPYADYYEGVMSIGCYRLPRAGRDVGIPWTNAVPEHVEKYQIGEKYRLPLWELVFHDCSCAHWYWGDCSDRCIATWDKRDLFNVLYATAPMYVCSRPWWDAHRDRYIKSYRMTEPVGTACGFSEMTDHAYLTDDMTVQRTKFSNGVVITVNFGDKPYVLPEGGEVGPMSYKIVGLDQ